MQNQQAIDDRVTGRECEVCGQPATDAILAPNEMPENVEAWIPVCSDACADAVFGDDDGE